MYMYIKKIGNFQIKFENFKIKDGNFMIEVGKINFNGRRWKIYFYIQIKFIILYVYFFVIFSF